MFFDKIIQSKLILITKYWLCGKNKLYLNKINYCFLKSGYFRQKNKRGKSCVLVYTTWESNILERVDMNSLTVKNILEIPSRDLICVCIYRTPHTVNLKIFFQIMEIIIIDKFISIKIIKNTQIAHRWRACHFRNLNINTRLLKKYVCSVRT